jgi:hypothetical protein
MRRYSITAVLIVSSFLCVAAQNQTKTESKSKTEASAGVATCPDKAEMQEEITETQALVARMQNRIIVMRNSIGTVRDFELRNALQVNADAWQDLLDGMKQRLKRMQAVVDRCEAREKIKNQ